MADIIREDVISVGWDIDSNPLIEMQKELDDLKKKLSGGLGDEEFDELKDSVNGANDSLGDMQREANKTKDNLGKTQQAANKLKEKFTDLGKKGVAAFKKIASFSFKALATGVAAVAVAVGKIGYEAVQAYADFEQLKGGVETLFKDNASTVMKYANNAYKTAGLSANQYMETVTSFSASLLQSLDGDTAKAAKYADMAISDMADNANKMGTDMSSIQYAYQGFAKQNYTMLDNLKLGYGGTKEEMQRLVKDAAKLDKSVDANSLSYANIVKAIHAVQDEMGILGTTQKEAEKTITGSLNAMKSSWTNLLTAMASGENLDQCIDNMVSSVEIFAGNVMPVAEKALLGLGTVVEKLAPIIADRLPELADKLLPPLIKATVSLAKGLIKSLPNIIKTVFESIGDILGEQFPALKGFGDFFNKHAGKIEKFIPVLLGLVGAFMAFNKIKSIGSVFSGLLGGGDSKGGKGAGMFGGLASLAKMKITDVLKGMLNLAIVLGGFTILAAALMAVAPLMAKLGDFKTVVQIIGIIGLLGLVGAALTVLAGICGMIPIQVVAIGLANIAIIIAGMSALFLLIGAVSLLNFNYGKMFKLIGIIGMLGLVGGALTLFAGICGAIPIPVVLAGLANIALVLGGMTALILAFGKLSEVKGINEFIEKGGALLVKLFNVIGEIAGALIGGIGEGVTASLPTIGKNLADFAESIKPLFNLFSGVDMTGVGEFFDAIGGFMLKMAGGKVLEFFGGSPDFAGVAEGLNTLATHEGIPKFFAMVNKIEEGAFNKGNLFFECLDGISNLPNVGGFAQLFSGENDFVGVANGLGKLACEGVKKFFSMVEGLSTTAFDNAKLFFEALDGISELPNVGGFAQLFSGKNDFSGVASGLKELSSEGVQRFFTMVNAINLDNLNGLWKSLENAGKLTTENLGSVIDKSLADIVTKISELPKRMGEALKNNSKNLSDGFVEMWKEAVKASVAPVNKLLDGANHILKEFGSKKKVISWTPYASGTDGHRGGNALVNDGNGAELVQMPNGNAFIPNGRNVFIPNAPQGMKVLPADQTAQMMGKNSPTFRYANGIGNIDVWSFYDNAQGLVNKITEGISYDGMSQLASNFGKSMVSTFSGEMPAWVDKLFEENRQSIASYVASKGVTQWLPTVIRALKMEGQYSLSNVARTLFQMKTESGGNPKAINLWDSNAKKGIPSKGLMQVIDPTFKAYARSGFNKNIYDPLSNILASIRYAVSRYGSLAKAYRGVGYANGGIATRPSIFGEDGAEMAIPLSRSKRKRGVSLWAQTGSMLGLSYTPESGGDEHMSYSVENNSYAPELHFHINNGSGNDRDLMRKIKKVATQAIADVIEGAERNNPKLKEV